MRIRFDLHQLNIFCTIVDLQSFSQASKKLHLTQPTLSNHIKQLENNTGTSLLDRGGKIVRPTPAGKLFYGYAQRILALSREAENSLNEFLSEFKGEIRLGSPPLLGELLLPERIAQFQRQHPQVKISLEISRAQEIIQRIESQVLDLGIVGLEMSHPRLVFQPFFEDRIVLAAPAQHSLAQKERVTLQALSRERVILRENGSRTRRAVENLFARDQKNLKKVFQNTIELGSFSAAKEGMKKGLGIAFLPELAIREELKTRKFKILNLPGTPIPRKFYLVFTSSWGKSPLGKVFLDCLMK